MALQVGNAVPPYVAYNPFHSPAVDRYTSYTEELQQKPLATPDAIPYTRSWRNKGVHEVSEAIRDALTQQDKLEGAIARIAHGCQAADALESIQSSVRGLRQFLNSLAHPMFFNEKIASIGGYCRAQDVFSIPELLENILHFVEMRDILQMMLVDKNTKLIIQASSKLQRQLSLVGDINSFLDQPFAYDTSTTDFLTTATKMNRVDNTVINESALGLPGLLQEGVQNKVQIRAFFPSDRLPNIGATCRAMLICQPPITEMTLSVACCSHSFYEMLYQPSAHYRSPRSPTKIKAAAGLTIGDLYDATQALASDHRLCPDAPAHMLDDEGYVKVHVAFDGELQLRADDPFLRPMPTPKAPYVDHPGLRESYTDTARMQAYTTAKQAGKSFKV